MLHDIIQNNLAILLHLPHLLAPKVLELIPVLCNLDIEPSLVC